MVSLSRSAKRSASSSERARAVDGVAAGRAAAGCWATSRDVGKVTSTMVADAASTPIRWRTNMDLIPKNEGKGRTRSAPRRGTAGALAGARRSSLTPALAVAAPNRAEKEPSVERRGIRLRLRVQRGHHLTTHSVGEEGADEHCGSRIDLAVGDGRSTMFELRAVFAQ